MSATADTMEASRAFHIGLDDTDMPDSPGTNQLARHLARALPAGFSCRLILRHQLLFDRRVPYTSQNGSASMLVRAAPGCQPEDLWPVLAAGMRDWYVSGSDPGLCLVGPVPDDVRAFGRRCQRELATQGEARELARRHGLQLAGLGGSEDGVIGALAAVGLLSSGDDGRVVHLDGWEWPDSFDGPQDIAAVLAHGVQDVREQASGDRVREGRIDIGKHLRPAYRGHRVVLFVERVDDASDDPAAAAWRAIKLP